MNVFKRVISTILTACLVLAVFSYAAFADATGEINSPNFWGDGGQVSINLSGCSGYGTITVVVEFEGSVSSASGWGFDSYTVDGTQVTAVVSSTGGNSWAFNGNPGIQVAGSNITGATLISVTGSGTGATIPDNSGNQSSQEPAQTAPDLSVDAPTGDDWLTTDGDRIVDMNGTEVWLTGCNWFGYNTGSNIFDGVWACNMREALESIADHGFNILRIPISAELLLQWSRGEYPQANFNHAYNPELESMNSLEIFDYALDILRANGVKVMLDIHSLPTDAMGHMLPLWYTGEFSEQDYLDALDWVSARYANNDTVIAFDLKNEPHGKASETEHAIWNESSDQNNWRRVAQLAGNVILDNNPHALIMIEGIQIFPIDPVSNNFTSTNDEDYYNSWWGGNLRAVEYYPIDFGSPERNRQIVYSPHDYGPAVYAQPWFEGGFTYESLYEDYWHEAWLYIDEEEIAPLLIGEWGGFMTGDNLTWMTYMRQLIAEYHLNHTFWCFNANSGDTGGLVLDDFVTWDADKYAFVEEVLWQNENGEYIGLDHVVPLGDNGICLSDYSGITEVPDIAHTGTTSSTTTSTTSVVASANRDESQEIIGSADSTTTVELKSDTNTKTFGYILVGLLIVAGGTLSYVLGFKSTKENA